VQTGRYFPRGCKSIYALTEVIAGTSSFDPFAYVCPAAIREIAPSRSTLFDQFIVFSDFAMI
jgi:hypothetical protein